MEVDSLLQLRDSLIAKASLNKMELEDCQDILNNIESDVSTRGFFWLWDWTLTGWGQSRSSIRTSDNSTIVFAIILLVGWE